MVNPSRWSCCYFHQVELTIAYPGDESIPLGWGVRQYRAVPIHLEQVIDRPVLFTYTHMTVTAGNMERACDREDIITESCQDRRPVKGRDVEVRARILRVLDEDFPALMPDLDTAPVIRR